MFGGAYSSSKERGEDLVTDDSGGVVARSAVVGGDGVAVGGGYKWERGSWKP